MNSLGLTHYLFDISLDIFNKLKNEKEFYFDTILRNKNVKIKVIYNRFLKNNLAYCKILDYDNLVFEIGLKKISLKYIVHEIKHIDRIILRNNKLDSNFYLRTVGKDVINKYKFLIKNSQVLWFTLEYIDDSEFESSYNEIYIGLKDKLENCLFKDKLEIINNYLNNNNVYLLYKHYNNNGGFDINEFFYKEKDKKRFVKILTNKINEFKNNYYKWNDLKHKLLFYLNFDKCDISTIKFFNNINYNINNKISKGYKKFYRLYSIF